jgi:predicted transcriptional regulator
MATSIRLAPEIERRLDALAARTGRTKAFYLREIIEQGLDESKITIWLPPHWSGSAKEKRSFTLLRK